MSAYYQEKQIKELKQKLKEKGKDFSIGQIQKVISCIGELYLANTEYIKNKDNPRYVAPSYATNRLSLFDFYSFVEKRDIVNNDK